MSLNRKQQGFTIVELLIVIVVIGILAALVITTFTGIQQKGRNTERTTDIKAIHGQLEAYYAQNGKYPSRAEMNTQDGTGNPTWVTTNLKGLDKEALKDPRGTSYTLPDTSASNVYSYVTVPASCDNTSGNECTKYTLEATLEGGGQYKKDSLN